MSHHNAPIALAMPKSTPGFAAKPYLQALFFGLVAALLLINGVRMTSAGMADFQAAAFLADWQAKSAEPSPRAWNVALQAATRANAHYPVPNGPYLERLGYIHAWQYFTQPFGSADAQPSREAARKAHRAAVQARPTWPYGWAALAEAKLNLLEFDAEFRTALVQAVHHGPNRADVHRRVASVGFVAWPQLSAEQKHQALRSGARAIMLARRHRAPLFSLAAAAGQQAQLCENLRAQGYRPSAQECPVMHPPTAGPQQG